MNVLIVGADGQLGQGLIATAPAEAWIVAHDIATLDITDAGQVADAVAAVKPAVIFNAAAYTAVDKAEAEPALAQAVNGGAVGHLAAAARAQGARLVHVSTDFVFDGRSGVPYRPDDAPNPASVYGRTKRDGEIAAGPEALVVRTAWVYAPVGRNFVRTMLGLMADRPEVRVVADQIGTPTYAPGLAEAMWRMAGLGVQGLWHYTDAGACSWYDFAVAIQEEALCAGLLERAVPVIPIATADYPTPAQRPHYSVLDKSATYALLGGPAPHWRENLRRMIAWIKANG